MPPLPPALILPTDPAADPTWLAWLDANRLTPLASRQLGDEPIAADVRVHLSAGYMQARAQWLHRRLALIAYLDLMQKTPAVPVILLKGAALAIGYYDDPACRPMNDIDVLIAPEQMSGTVQRLREAGYLEQGLAPGADVGYMHHFIFDTPTTPPVRIELHHTLPLLPEKDEPPSLSWFLQQVEPVALAGRQALILNPTALLLHQATHAVLEHGGEQGAILIWYYDIDQLWRRRGADIAWHLLLAQAQRLRWEAALHYALRMTRTYFGTTYPDNVVAWLDTPVEQLSGYDTLARSISAGRSSSQVAWQIMQEMTPRRRLQHAMHMAFPHPAYMRKRYPFADSWLLPLAYPYRWFDAGSKLLKSYLR